jgi:hypothetical protein
VARQRRADKPYAHPINGSAGVGEMVYVLVAKQGELVYYVFDLLRLGDVDVRGEPCWVRG